MGGIIEGKVRAAFEKYEKDGDIFDFAIQMAHIGDYSIRSMSQWYALTTAVETVKEEKINLTINDLAFRKELPK